jgi:hypothetical protein
MKRLLALLYNYDTELLELLLGVIYLGIGTILLWPTDTFNAYNGYRTLAQSGLPEWVWGLSAFGIGSMLCIALGRNHRQLRQLATSLSAHYGFVFGLLILLAGPISPGTWVYTCLALAAVWCHIRKGRI